jgi:hypothetical protein
MHKGIGQIKLERRSISDTKMLRKLVYRLLTFMLKIYWKQGHKNRIEES